jgi:hypothetical protein
MKLRPVKRKKVGVPAKEKGRLRPIVTITMTPEGIEMADELAMRRGLTRSSLLDQLVREEARRERVGLFKP